MASDHPPARVLPADGHRTVHRPPPRGDSPGELSEVTLLTPTAAVRGRQGCIHRGLNGYEPENVPACKQPGRFFEVTVEYVENRGHLSRCRVCFPAGFGGVLTPVGEYVPVSLAERCPFCERTVILPKHLPCDASADAAELEALVR